MKTYRRRYRGMTLTEVAILTMIVGIVLTGLWVAVDAVYRNSRVSTTSKQLMEITSRIRALYGISRGNMMDMTIKGTDGALVFSQLGAVPQDMVDKSVSPAVVTHIWQGTVEVDALHTNVDGDSFSLTLNDVPQYACSDLLVRMTGGSRDAGMIAAGAGGASFDQAQMPVGLSSAVGACGSVMNVLKFTFMLKS